MRTIKALITGAGLALALAAPLSAAPASAAPGPLADYVVLLGDANADPAAVAAHHVRRHGGHTGHVYRHALRGFSAQLTPAAAEALRRDPRVTSIQPDHLMSITDQAVPTGIRRAGAVANPNLKINGVEDYTADTDIAIIDTGIDAGHPDLTVAARTDCLNTTICRDNTGPDDHGHGSHVAGTAAARDNGIGVTGIAPGARLWSVKVLNAQGSGQLSGVAAGVDWVAAHAGEIEVANMSLGCDNCATDALDQAIAGAVAKGVVFVVAAGNNRKDARTFSPANHPDVVTVSALADFDGAPGGRAASTCRADQDDTLADFSNFGPLVEIAAPGTCILSTSRNGGYATLSGTSMAAPHVAGAAGLLTASGHRATNRDQVLSIRQRLIDTGSSDWRDDSGDSIREPLLNVTSTQDYPAGSADPGRPTASFTSSCSTASLTCSFDAGSSTDPDGTITRYTWDFGDGSTTTGKTASHTYPRPGYYSVLLTVTDNSGKTNTARRLVKAGDLPPTAALSGRCQSSSCTFDGRGSSDEEGAITSYRWDFGDGSTGSGATAAHAYPAATATYTIRLTVTDSAGQSAAATGRVRCTKVVTTAICFIQP
ncbi:S8 family serine peptidase [Nonomuraea endophytica]|uniref:Subtilisin family serine protease n=1 Tax=Nonomuraea endophytica TaxID=714136 RepID=A0A7W8AA84_9ACTN|nr:S8 family serine peptidase [Nonomuraea endophytica]MBB5081515.1 subtilisin family serine protease [Nonomuraea endophytica]